MRLSGKFLAASLFFVFSTGAFFAQELDARSTLCPIVTLLRQVGAFVAIVMFSWAGIGFMTSGTDPIKHGDAQKKLEYVIMGMLVILFAFYIVAKLFAGVNVLTGGDCPWV
jgi:hypothetical protein